MGKLLAVALVGMAAALAAERLLAFRPQLAYCSKQQRASRKVLAVRRGLGAKPTVGVHKVFPWECRRDIIISAGLLAGFLLCFWRCGARRPLGENSCKWEREKSQASSSADAGRDRPKPGHGSAEDTGGKRG